MQYDRFTIAVKYDGKSAVDGNLDASDHEAAVSAARRLLAAHAHAFLHHKVPNAAVAAGNGYHIFHSGSRTGCHIDYWTIVLGVTAISAQLYPNHMRGALDACVNFFRKSLRAVAYGEENDAEFARIEPVLEMPTGNRTPFLDLESELIWVRQELARLTERVLFAGLARPIGRSADRMTIIIDEQTTLEVDESLTRRHLEKGIERALQTMKLRERKPFDNHL